MEHGVQKGLSGEELWLLAEEYPGTCCRDCCFDYYSVYLSGDDDDIPLVTVIKMLCAVAGVMSHTNLKDFFPGAFGVTVCVLSSCFVSWLYLFNMKGGIVIKNGH